MARGWMMGVASGALLAAYMTAGGAGQAAETLKPGTALTALPRPTHNFLSAALSPDGRLLASVEGDEGKAGGTPIQALVIREVEGGTEHAVPLPCGAVAQCTPSSLTWAPDGARLAFVLRSPGSHAHAIYTVGPKGGEPRRLVDFNGTLVDLRYGADGRLAVLATENADKEVGAVEAGAAVTGVVGSDVHEQRIAVVEDGGLKWASPADLFVYEYDWKAGSGAAAFVGTAAPGDGDNNWWSAKLYRFDGKTAAATLIHAPSSPRQQLAHPRVSPDGREAVFIGGLMSDFGSTGGDVYLLPLDGGAARNLTEGAHSTATSVEWACGGTDLLVSRLTGDQRELVTQGTTGTSTVLAAGAYSLSMPSRSCASGLTATIRQDFTHAPELYVGPMGQWRPLTHANDALTAATDGLVGVHSLTWTSDGHAVQGWLLLPPGTPAGSAAAAKLPMITTVHGGPAAASQPGFLGQGMTRQFLQQGYAVFAPNPRGSFGQGEAFTQANVRDLGHGDLRDILAGIDEAERQAPIDDARLGITGHSYGGFMTMWTVTQTNRFKAAVAGAGIVNWQSYYGENGIDGWLLPYFGATVYDDPDIYAKSSPLTFIKQAHTPTLEVVGERDIECPAVQTQEFWHALNALGVPTQFVVYAGEGHALRDPKHIADRADRTLAWFGHYLK